MLWVFFSSALVCLSDADRESDEEGKRSSSGDLKFYPPNLLSMECCLTAAYLTHPYPLSVKMKIVMLFPKNNGNDNVEDDDDGNYNYSNDKDRPAEKEQCQSNQSSSYAL